MVSTQRKITDSLRVYNTFWDIGNMPIKCLSVHITATITEDSWFFSPTLHSYTDTESTIYATILQTCWSWSPENPLKYPDVLSIQLLCLPYTLEVFFFFFWKVMSCRSLACRLQIHLFLIFIFFPIQAANKPYTVLYCIWEGGKRSVAFYEHQREPNTSQACYTLTHFPHTHTLSHTLPGKNPVYFWEWKFPSLHGNKWCQPLLWFLL